MHFLFCILSISCADATEKADQIIIITVSAYKVSLMCLQNTDFSHFNEQRLKRVESFLLFFLLFFSLFFSLLFSLLFSLFLQKSISAFFLYSEMFLLFCLQCDCLVSSSLASFNRTDSFYIKCHIQCECNCSVSCLHLDLLWLHLSFI